VNTDIGALEGRVIRGEGNCMIITFMTCTFRQIFLGDQIKKDEMDRACGTYGVEETCLHVFGVAYMFLVGQLEGKTTWKTCT
jgi:hypothetical protein